METKISERNEYCRSFLVDDLPQPMTPADPHLQYFDNYIEGTSIRLRAVRDPKTKLWIRSLEKRRSNIDEDIPISRISGFELDESEYEAFKTFEGNEIRKNRYYFDDGNMRIEIDIYLGRLWGLNIARVCFETAGSFKDFVLSEYLNDEITGNDFFDGKHLVACVFSDVQEAYAKMKGE